MEKLILTDVDGVLLSWEDHFHAYMKSHGHQRAYDGSSSYWKESEYNLSQDEARKMVYHFNTSAWMLDLPTFKDSRSGVARLVDEGYRFHAITAMGVDPYAREARKINLERVFGYNVFSELTVTDMYDPDSKREVLDQYRDSGLFWIEDKPENAELGAELGLRSILLDHPHNSDYQPQNKIPRVSSWSDICDLILG